MTERRSLLTAKQQKQWYEDATGEPMGSLWLTLSSRILMLLAALEDRECELATAHKMLRGLSNKHDHAASYIIHMTDDENSRLYVAGLRQDSKEVRAALVQEGC